MDLRNSALRLRIEVNQAIIQHRQNIIFSTMTNARWFQRNEDIHHRYRHVQMVYQVIQDQLSRHQ